MSGITEIKLKKVYSIEFKNQILRYKGDPIKIEMLGALSKLFENYYRVALAHGKVKSVPSRDNLIKEVKEVFPEFKRFK
jgi:hypothetical protein